MLFSKDDHIKMDRVTKNLESLTRRTDKLALRVRELEESKRDFADRLKYLEEVTRLHAVQIHNIADGLEINSKEIREIQADWQFMMKYSTILEDHDQRIVRLEQTSTFA